LCPGDVVGNSREVPLFVSVHRKEGTEELKYAGIDSIATKAGTSEISGDSSSACMSHLVTAALSFFISNR
jgi:hypothetical protein